MDILVNLHSEVKIENLQFDFVQDQVHSFSNSVTTHPIQDRQNVGINIHQNPAIVSFSGKITNSPLNNDPAKETLVDADCSNRVPVGYIRLLEIGGFDIPKTPGGEHRRVKEPELVNVIDEVSTFTSMIIDRLDVNVNYGGNEIDVKISFVKFPIVETKFSDIEKVKDVGPAKNMRNKIQVEQKLGKKKSKDKPKSFGVKAKEFFENLFKDESPAGETETPAEAPL